MHNLVLKIILRIYINEMLKLKILLRLNIDAIKIKTIYKISKSNRIKKEIKWYIWFIKILKIKKTGNKRY